MNPYLNTSACLITTDVTHSSAPFFYKIELIWEPFASKVVFVPEIVIQSSVDLSAWGHNSPKIEKVQIWIQINKTVLGLLHF